MPTLGETINRSLNYSHPQDDTTMRLMAMLQLFGQLGQSASDIGKWINEQPIRAANRQAAEREMALSEALKTGSGVEGLDPESALKYLQVKMAHKKMGPEGVNSMLANIKSDAMTKGVPVEAAMKIEQPNIQLQLENQLSLVDEKYPNDPKKSEAEKIRIIESAYHAAPEAIKPFVYSGMLGDQNNLTPIEKYTMEAMRKHPELWKDTVASMFAKVKDPKTGQEVIATDNSLAVTVPDKEKQSTLFSAVTSQQDVPKIIDQYNLLRTSRLSYVNQKNKAGNQVETKDQYTIAGLPADYEKKFDTKDDLINWLKTTQEGKQALSLSLQNIYRGNFNFTPPFIPWSADAEVKALMDQSRRQYQEQETPGLFGPPPGPTQSIEEKRKHESMMGY